MKVLVKLTAQVGVLMVAKTAKMVGHGFAFSMSVLMLTLMLTGCQHSSWLAAFHPNSATHVSSPVPKAQVSSVAAVSREHQVTTDIDKVEAHNAGDVGSSSHGDAASAELSAAGLFVESTEDEGNDVVVKGGYVCVPEKSPTAITLADILASGLTEDLSAPVEDEKASKIDPIVPADHPDVDKWERYFLNNRGLFQRYLDRGANYKTLVSTVLEEEGLPPELFYLAMVESGFRPAARSSASAVGIWQFISATGKRYGLKVNYHIDERKDPVRATRAASRYLASLYRVYQNWELAAAAYNAGENRVLSAIMRGHTRDFWELSRRKLLPRETRDYVPKMMAAIKIGQNIDQHGFTFKATNNYGIPVAAEVPGGLRLKEVSTLIGVSESSLKILNPHLRRNTLPPGSSYKLWVKDAAHSEKIRLAYAQLAMKRRLAQKSSVSKVGTGHHLVRRGQTLESIGRRYNLSVSELKRLNGIRGHLIYVGQKLRVHDQHKSADSYYVIKKGDTLYSIARRYRTSVRDLQRKNRIRGSRVLIGQKIRL